MKLYDTIINVICSNFSSIVSYHQDNKVNMTIVGAMNSKKHQSNVLILSVLHTFFVLCFLSITNSGLSQTTNHQPLKFYDNKDGLSQGTINCIIQDKHGYMWFGTQDGLNKFDGTNFTVFKHSNDISNTISDNYISSIIEDKNEDLWIGTRNGGINKYDLETGMLTYYLHQNDEANSISHNRVSSIVETNDGIIWIGTYGGGLNRFNPKTNEFTKFVYDEDDDTSISNDEINYLLSDSNGDQLWIGTTKGLNKFDIKTEKFTRYSINQNKLNSDDILSLWEDDNQRIWIGINGGGLCVLNKQTEKFTTYKHNPNNRTSLSNNDVITLTGAEDGKIWVGTDGGYLNLFDPSKGKFIFQEVAFPRLKTLYKDSAGDLWVGMRGGINIISSFNAMFNQYHTDAYGNPIAPNGDIHAICVDDKNNIWAGSSVDGLVRIDRNTLEVKTYTYTGQSHSISNNNITFLFIDSYNTMWIGTNNGLNQYEKNTDTFVSYLPDSDNPLSISSAKINYLYEDSKNNLWICTDNGLNVMDREKGTFTTLKNNPKDANSLFSNKVSKIIEDDEGIYWIGFLSSGIDRYDAGKNSFTHHQHIEGNTNSLSNDRISQIYNDKIGNLWIATYGGGLDKFDKATKTFTNYNEKHGLANASLYCVLPDKSGNLWMSHNEGISKFDITRKTFKNYFEGTEFNGRAFYQTKSGEILLGSIYAVVAFYPEDVVENIRIPPVHVNEFKLFNEILTPYDGKNILKKVTEETDTMVLSYDQNFFSLGFVSLNFVNSENNQLKYKLENFDSEWNEANEYHHANYTNVPPGNYTFKVKGSNNDLIWNDEGDSIFIAIRYPWWDTLLFKTVAILMSVAILVLMYKLRTRNIKKQKADLEKLVGIRTKEVRTHEEEIIKQKESITKQNTELRALNEEKNKLIQIVSHDLRSPLNQIKGLASIIKAINPTLNQETDDSLTMINDLVERQKNMISKILDTSAIDTNSVNLQLVDLNVHELIKEVRSTMKIVAESKGILIEQLFYNKDLYIEADKNYLIQILENLISNAIKFSPPNKSILISTDREHDKVIISIKDEGPGISEEDMKRLFEPYTKLSAQPTANEDSSGLGLSIAKKYMDHMQGKIWCQSKEGKGANFVLSFQHKDIVE